MSEIIYPTSAETLFFTPKVVDRARTFHVTDVITQMDAIQQINARVTDLDPRLGLPEEEVEEAAIVMRWWFKGIQNSLRWDTRFAKADQLQNYHIRTDLSAPSPQQDLRRRDIDPHRPVVEMSIDSFDGQHLAHQLATGLLYPVDERTRITGSMHSDRNALADRIVAENDPPFVLEKS